MWSLFDSFLTCLQVKAANSMQLHTCWGEGGETGATDKLLGVFHQVFAKLSPGSAQTVDVSPGFAAGSCGANPECFVDCALCDSMRYHWTNTALVLLVYRSERFNLLVENLLAALCTVHCTFTGADCCFPDTMGCILSWCYPGTILTPSQNSCTSCSSPSLPSSRCTKDEWREMHKTILSLSSLHWPAATLSIRKVKSVNTVCLPSFLSREQPSATFVPSLAEGFSRQWPLVSVAQGINPKQLCWSLQNCSLGNQEQSRGPESFLSFTAIAARQIKWD